MKDKNEDIYSSDYEKMGNIKRTNEDNALATSKREETNIFLNSSIVSYTSEITVDALISSLINSQYVIPSFQRFFVWNQKQVAELALSLIRDVPIPSIYLYTNANKQLVIMDGQQRATAVFLYFGSLKYLGSKNKNKNMRFDFNEINTLNEELESQELELDCLENDISIKKKDKAAKLSEIKNTIKCLKGKLRELGFVRFNYSVNNGAEEKNISFNQFAEEEKEFLRGKRLTITVVECMSDNASRVYAGIFKVLNTGGTPLSSQEIRNGVYYQSRLYQKLLEINNNDNWRKLYGLVSKSSKDVEILLKAMALNYFTKLENQKLEIVFDGTFTWSNIMEEYSEQASFWNDKTVDEQIGLMTLFLNNIKNIKGKCNKAVFEAAFVAYSALKCNSEVDYSLLMDLSKEDEFQKGNVLSNKASVKDRLSKAVRFIGDRIHEY